MDSSTYVVIFGINFHCHFERIEKSLGFKHLRCYFRNKFSLSFRAQREISWIQAFTQIQSKKNHIVISSEARNLLDSSTYVVTFGINFHCHFERSEKSLGFKHLRSNLRNKFSLSFRAKREISWIQALTQ